jgi:hypothetical protein
MKKLAYTLAMLSIVCILLGEVAFAGSKETQTTKDSVRDAGQIKAQHLEGEKRFRENCGRCHNAPAKFNPRMMGTIIRHMRVRAMLTDDEMKVILKYITE